MNPAKTDQRTEDSLVDLLLPIARLLVGGGTGIDELVRAAKRAYVRAAMDTVLPQDRRVNVSRLSVATGMTRKEVSALLKHSKGKGQGATRRSGEQRALRVLRGWLTDPRFQNRDGRPEDLSYRGHRRSFTVLVKLYGGDVTPKSVLHELERIGIVEATEAGALRVRTQRKHNSIDVHYQLAELARLFEDFALAVVRPNGDAEAPPFFGFKDSTVPSTRDAASFVRTFSRRGAALLEDFQQWSAGRDRSKRGPHRDHEGVRVGLGVYLLRSNPPLITNPPEKAADRVRVRAMRGRHR
ncbi:MAG: DUF6502 family protein [Steroidobacteraceae bacterium]